MQGTFRRAIIVIMVALDGCAHAPRPEIATTGRWPVEGKPSFGFGQPDPGSDAPLRTLVAACLGGKGMTVSASPAYLVQIGLSDRPPGSDVLLANDAAAGQAAARRHRQSLAVSITDTGSGREVYRVQVTEQYRRVATRRPPSALAETACGAIGATAAPAPRPS